MFTTGSHSRECSSEPLMPVPAGQNELESKYNGLTNPYDNLPTIVIRLCFPHVLLVSVQLLMKK